MIHGRYTPKHVLSVLGWLRKGQGLRWAPCAPGMVISSGARSVCQVHLNMFLIPVCLPNPGWRVIWSGQKESGDAICNLGVDPAVVQQQSGFASLHFALVSLTGSGQHGPSCSISHPPFTVPQGVL